MYYSYPQIYLQEVPGEISLGLSISGCNIKCKGCHSTETWDPTFGEHLSPEVFEELLSKHKHITCVLFYGGEWDDELVTFLKQAKMKGFKTALYSGLDYMIDEYVPYLDYYKIGPYIESRKGLNNPTTNQILYEIKANKDIIDITYKLQRD